MTETSLRRRAYDILERTDKTDARARAIEIGLIVLIALNIVAVTLETIAPLYQAHKAAFDAFELFSVAVFSVEYAARLWCCVEDPRFEGRRFPRLSYAMTPMALIDLAAILPFYLAIIFQIDLRFLRVLRLLRVFKLTRYSAAMTMLLNVFREEANAFFAGFFILFVLLILTASGIYLVEHDDQPDKFGSVPAAMWWAVATLTTVGYGDVTPITAAGKLFGAAVTIIGVGMAALPAGILASGLADQLRRRRENLTSRFRVALEDGVIDAEEEDELESLRKELGLSREAAEDIREEVMMRDRTEVRRCPNCGTLVPRPEE